MRTTAAADPLTAVAADDEAPVCKSAAIALADELKSQGDLTGALMRYREFYAALRQRASQSDPRLLLEMALTLERIGEVLAAQGDLSGALDPLGQALDIRRRLAVIEPANILHPPDRAASVKRVGDALVLKSAIAAFRASIDPPAGERRDEADREAGRHASWDLKTFGATLEARGDLIGALTLYHESLAIRRAAVARDPGNPAALLDLSWILCAIGNALQARGDLAGARQVGFRYAISFPRPPARNALAGTF
jgi:tetratricopeptide (TPR) repeat protein